MTREELKKLIEEIVHEAFADTLSGSSCSEGFSVDVDGVIDDIRDMDFRERLLLADPEDPGFYLELKARTEARLGLGHAGPRMKTLPYLRLLADNAGSRDSVISEPCEDVIDANGFFRVQTLCEDKYMYLSRPDLGRGFPDEEKAKLLEECVRNADVQIIASEGLSSKALEQNITDLKSAIEQGLKVHGLSTGTPIYVKYSRVPAMDVITELLGPSVTIMLIGERPGLSTYASLSAYMTYKGHVGMEEAGRTVVSNIHEHGTSPVEAGAEIAEIAWKMTEQKASGIELDLMR